MDQIINNICSLTERIARVVDRCSRPSDSVELVVVTKGRSIPEIQAVLTAGVTNVGENRVQEAQQKYSAVNSGIAPGKMCRWHLVGHLQRNKVKAALDMFSLIHSVDSLRLLVDLARHAEARAQAIDVLVQVNTTLEASKYGLASSELLGFMADAQTYPAVNIVGLMTIGRLSPSPEANRPAFALLKDLAEKVETEQFPGVTMQYLSMGMTNDFEIAIEEGANLVRIGRAIFEPTT